MTTEIGKDIAKARALLERGLLVAIPTETVYGLAANALDEDAVVQIFEVKDRPRFDPLIAPHVADQLSGKIPYILDGGACSVGLESMIVTEEAGRIVILRLGGIAVQEIEELVGSVVARFLRQTVRGAETAPLQSPGSL